MIPNYKAHHKSNSTLYSLNIVKGPPFGSTSLISAIKPVYASPGVVWQDIAAEVVKLMIMPEAPENLCLWTCTTEYPEFFVSLTLDGFMRLAHAPNSLISPIRINDFAKELCDIRDHYLNLSKV